MSLEGTIGREAMILLKRNPKKYAPNISGLYLLSLQDYGRGKAARAGYFFFRNIDDVLDGDREVTEDPVEYAHRYRCQIAEGVCDQTDPISELGYESLKMFEARSRPGDNVRQDYLDEIDAMLLERELMQTRRVLTDAELREYHRKLFAPVMNLTFIGLGSQIRSAHVPEFWECLGITYSIRDIDSDWENGIINFPREVLTSAGLHANSRLSDVRSNAMVAWWQQDRLEYSRQALLNLQDRVQQLVPNEKTTLKLCNNRIARMMKIIEANSV